MRSKKAFAVLLAANFEVIVIMVFAHQVGIYLNEKYPELENAKEFSYLGGIIIVVTVWIKLFKYLLNDRNKTEP